VNQPHSFIFSCRNRLRRPEFTFFSLASSSSSPLPSWAFDRAKQFPESLRPFSSDPEGGRTISHSHSDRTFFSSSVLLLLLLLLLLLQLFLQLAKVIVPTLIWSDRWTLRIDTDVNHTRLKGVIINELSAVSYARKRTFVHGEEKVYIPTVHVRLHPATLLRMQSLFNAARLHPCRAVSLSLSLSLSSYSSSSLR
jgi:hypothetical protein